VIGLSSGIAGAAILFAGAARNVGSEVARPARSVGGVIGHSLAERLGEIFALRLQGVGGRGDAIARLLGGFGSMFAGRGIGGLSEGLVGSRHRCLMGLGRREAGQRWGV